MAEHGRRAIPEYEIAMAIIQCNTKNWCNPEYPGTPSLSLSNEDETEKKNSDNELLVPDTCEPQLNIGTDSMANMRVTESPLSNSQNSNESSKRKRELCFENTSDDEAELVALSKRYHTQGTRNTNSSSEEKKNLCVEIASRPLTPPPIVDDKSPLYVVGIPATPCPSHIYNACSLMNDISSSFANSCTKEKTYEEAKDISLGMKKSLENRADTARAKVRAAARAEAEIGAEEAKSEEETTVAENRQNNPKTRHNDWISSEEVDKPMKILERKRVRITVIEGNEREEDLFSFGNSEKRQKKRSYIKYSEQRKKRRAF